MPSTKEPKIGDAHHRLDVFVGKWHTEGTSFADGQTAENPCESGVPWTSDEQYEWLPGGFFLSVNRAHGFVVTDNFGALEFSGAGHTVATSHGSSTTPASISEVLSRRKGL